MSARNLAREDIIALKGYRAAEQIPDSIRLNANEAPKSLEDSESASLNRYPDVHPIALRQRMAELFLVPPEQLLVTRGSSEAIDVLVRTFCRAYRDNIVTATPSFEMYRFYADVQGVDLVETSLPPDQGFHLDTDEIIERCNDETKLVFLCSPNNPTGGSVSKSDVLKLVHARRNKSIIVVDEAYIEFSTQTSLGQLTHEYDNLVVLRTLSKAYALAGARCGAAIGHADLIDILSRVLPPYSFPTPVMQRVLNLLRNDGINQSSAAIAEIVAERQRMYESLRSQPVVARVWPSEANFLLVRFHDIANVLSYLQQKRILIRNFSMQPGLDSCARITIGTRAENDALLSTLTNAGISL